MKFIRFFIAIVAGVSLLASIPTPASALSAQDWRAGRIIDDSIFYNKSSMSIAQIQQFLDSKITCDTWGTKPYAGTTRRAYSEARGVVFPLTCLNTYHENPTNLQNNLEGRPIPAGGMSAAHIIWAASQQYDINPQALIVLIQKEQALVADDWPWPAQFRSATGFGCPDTAACDTRYYGFYNQVFNAARQFRLYANNPNAYNHAPGNSFVRYNPNAACGGSNVFIENQATASLYNYTPYQPNAAAISNITGTGDNCSSYGNRNFWRLFTEWFGSTQATALLRGSGHTVYVLGSTPNTLYAVPSGEVLYAYGLHNTPVTQVSDAYINSFANRPQLTTLFMQPNDGTIYLADSGHKFGIASGEHCTRWNLPCGNTHYIAHLPRSITELLLTEPPLSNLMQYGDTIYAMENGAKRPILDRSYLSSSPLKNERITTLWLAVNTSQPMGQPLIPDGRFIRIDSSGAIYYYFAGSYYTFSSYDNFKNWWDDSTVINDRQSQFNTTPPPATLLADIVSDNNSVYAVHGRNKLLLPNGSISAPANGNAASAHLLQKKTTQIIDHTKALALPNGTIVTLQGGTLRPIATMSDLRLMFDNENIIPAPISLVQAYSVGKLYTPSGSIIRPADSSALYIYGSDKKLWALGNLNELQATLPWGGNSVTVAPFAHIDMSEIAIFNSLISINGKRYAVQQDSSIRSLPAAIFNNLADTATPLSQPIDSHIVRDNRDVSFIRFDNGTIFQISNESIRPLATISTYLSSGGSAANTVQLPLKALSAFTVGSVVP